MALTTGDRLGPYEIIAPLGEGGMGVVYRARDTKLKREVAIKVLPEAFAQDRERLARFQREAELLATLSHPNIATIFGIEDDHGTVAIVMELVEGEDLSQRIGRGAMPLDEALAIARQVADALETAHERGIVHRDLKPANIKLSADGKVKVLDFGLAKLVAGGVGETGTAGGFTQSPTLSVQGTFAGTILGTAAYMSPEQARGKPVDHRSDIWAFGCVCYEMLAGRQCFETGESISDAVAAILKSEPEWSALPAGLPPAVRRLIERCLQKDRRQRLQAIGEARIAIDRILSGADVATEAATPSRRHTRAWREILAWTLLAASLVGASVAWLRPSAAPPPAPLVRFQVTAPPGTKRKAFDPFAVSPDGRSLAFEVFGRDGTSQIWVRKLESPEAQLLPGSNLGRNPFWSPDGQSVAFFKENGLYRSELTGNTERRLCDVPSGQGQKSGSWGSSDVILFASQGSGLFRVPASGGRPVPATTLDANAQEVSHLKPRFLPDGRHFLYIAFGPTVRTISVGSLDDASSRQRLVESRGAAAYGAGWLLYRPDGNDLVAQRLSLPEMATSGEPWIVRDRLTQNITTGEPGFSVSDSVLAVDRPPDAQHQLVWVDRSGQRLRPLGPDANITEFALAPDEERVVVHTVDATTRRGTLRLFDGRSQNGSVVSVDVADAMSATWSADGERIYFRALPEDLRVITVGAASSQHVDSRLGRPTVPRSASRDGRYLLLQGLGLPRAMWRLPLDASGPTEVLIENDQNISQPEVSPDGRWLAFTLIRAGGERLIFVQPLARADRQRQFSVKDGYGPRWSHDSRTLYYESNDGFMSVGVDERDGLPVPGVTTRLFAVQTQGFVINQPYNIEVAARGQRFLVNTIVGDSDNVPIEITLNWTAGMNP